MKQTDIIISGGGIAGISLSLLLAQAGLSVSLIEPYPPKTDVPPNGRTVALMNSSLNVLHACEGLWERIEPIACPMKAMRIIDISRAVKEPVTIDFPASDLGLEQFSYNIPNTPLRNVLYGLAEQHNHIEIYNCALNSYEAIETSVIATLEDSEQIKARLIVGADGRSSRVREIAGIETSKKEYDQSAITCVINHSRPHENISTEFHKPHGPLALVPLKTEGSNNQSSVVWVEKHERATEICALSAQEFAEALMEKTDEILGGITLETEPQSWPLCTIKAKSFAATRCALVAEAAHVMSPITAQGLNLSLRDVAALAESIVDAARLGMDIGSNQTLNGYEKRRRLDVETRVFGVDGMNHLVSHESKAIKELRRLGLKSLDALPGLKALSMHIGLAPQMDMGRLAKGKAL